MRTVKWNAFLSCLCGFAVVLGGVAVSAHADVTTEKGASILIFPKVRADGTFDTVIQIANLSNNMVHAHCFYVNASLQDVFTQAACSVPSSTCVPLCQETDFDIWLTKQQPTHWSVRTGRNYTSSQTFGSDDSGFAPGHVPPLRDTFIGELKCIEVTDSGEPITRNDLKGEATLVSLRNELPPADLSAPGTVYGDVAKYNAIGLRGNPDVAPSNPLLLDAGATYDACPATLILNHFASGASDMVVDELFGTETCTSGFCSVHTTQACVTDAQCPPLVPSKEFTDLTLVPCSEDLENQIPKSVKVQFLIYNEFEEQFSASTTVSCFLETELSRIDAAGNVNSSVFGQVLGTEVAHTTITPVVQPDGSSGGLIGIAERITTMNTGTATAARAAYNLHSEGSFIPPNGPDAINLPAVQ